MIEMSDNINELAAALSKAQAIFTAVPKSKTAKVVSKRTSSEYSYKYADLADAWDVCRKPLADNGLSVVQAPVSPDRGVICVVTVLLHTSGQWMRSTLAMEAADATPQSIGSVITYARRYGLAAMVGLVTDDDTDAQEHSGAGRNTSGAQAGTPNGRASYNGTTRGEGAPRAAGPNGAKSLSPADAAEAEQRFYERYGEAIGGTTWQAAQRFFGHLLPKPATVDEWIKAAEAARDRIKHGAAEAAQ